MRTYVHCMRFSAGYLPSWRSLVGRGPRRHGKLATPAEDRLNQAFVRGPKVLAVSHLRMRCLNYIYYQAHSCTAKCLLYQTAVCLSSLEVCASLLRGKGRCSIGALSRWQAKMAKLNRYSTMRSSKQRPRRRDSLGKNGGSVRARWRRREKVLVHVSG